MIEECFGEICPIPFLKFEKIYNNLNEGEKFTIIVDHSCAKVKIENHCKNLQIKVEIVEPINGIWEITVWK
ncbi:sulfurtransferase TusA family protein [Streptobacillus felis]|uniref:Sulfurtransferase TusA family protein n=1 Tax=Streptobacillus felis TaxID=1384509 RepID=A0A7Z0PDU2_9FUSO|nr:sulfurtransferase TusA family protein [Streptobacillus felis]NYV27327.1 sulfurtransferase TusA family protein [Streptobacillus felis]